MRNKQILSRLDVACNLHIAIGLIVHVLEQGRVLRFEANARGKNEDHMLPRVQQGGRETRLAVVRQFVGELKACLAGLERIRYP